MEILPLNKFLIIYGIYYIKAETMETINIMVSKNSINIVSHCDTLYFIVC